MAALDALQQIGTQAGNSLIGRVTKAIIEIEDERATPAQVTVTEEPVRRAGGLLASASALDGLASQVTEAVSSGTQAVQQLTQTATQAAALPQNKRFEVKFNPSEISFQAQGGTRVSKTNFLPGGRVDMQYVQMKPMVQIRVPLVFEDMERTETFMMEKLTDPTALVRTGVTAGIAAVTGKVHSVRPQVEGFVGALRNNRTRKVTFLWGNMAYKGVLNEVSAAYTMFSIDGHPVRATVNIGILCGDETERDGNMGQWQASYQRAFAGNASKLESLTQNVGNLLNINL